ncbi:hypothetical protein AB0C34_19635 [Nocardia sp. NPDC049220]|uniref:hypothetical protein n=1 Tax=Nocardia sp. NPDC049220 TaxID=3155273 RepID=UPI0033C0D890
MVVLLAVAYFSIWPSTRAGIREPTTIGSAGPRVGADGLRTPNPVGDNCSMGLVTQPMDTGV